MGTLSFYLIVAFFSYYNFSPKRKTALWKYAVLIPFIKSLIFLAYYDYSNPIYSWFEIGIAVRECFIPIIISGFVIYFLLKKKIVNEGATKFPAILFVFIIITFGLGLYQNHLKEERQKKVELILQEFDSSYSAKTTKQLTQQLPVNKESKEEQNALYTVRETAKQLKKQLPVNVRDSSIVYNVEFDESKKDFITYYRETDLEKSELTQEDINFLKNMMRDNLLETAKNNPKNKAFVKAGVTLTFNYEDKYGNPLLNITLYPEEYR